MAVGFSQNELNYARKKFFGNLYKFGTSNFFRKIINYFLTRKYYFKFSLVNFKRYLVRNMILIFFQRKLHAQDVKFNVNVDNLDKIKDTEKLKNDEFIFLENFLEEDCYYKLLKSWPDINHFNHNKKITAHYDSNFKFEKNFSTVDSIFKKYPKNFIMRKFYEFLCSTEVEKLLNQFVMFEKKNYEVVGILSSMATKNAYLIPHQDGVTKDGKTKDSYNFIFFLDGYDKDPALSGGTGIYKDNEFKYPLLVPKTLKNSVLVYKSSSSKFYHGFKSIECPSNFFRKVLTFQIHKKI